MPFNLLLATAKFEDAQRVIRAIEPVQGKLASISTVYSGSELLLSAKRDIPDIIITELALPDTNALSVIHTLRQHGVSSRMIVISSEKNFEEAHAAIGYRVDRFLLAPLDGQQLLLSVQELIGELEVQTSALSLMEYRKVIGRLLLDRGRIALGDFPVEIVNDLYNTHFKDGAYRVLVVIMDKSEQAPYSLLEKHLDACVAALFGDARGLCHDMVMRYAHKRVHMLLNYPPDMERQLAAALEHRLQYTAQSLPAGITVTFCCSARHDSIQALGLMAEESMDAAWTRFTRKTGSLLTKEAEPPCPPRIAQIYAEAEAALKRACFELDLDRFQRQLQQLFSLPKSAISRSETRHLIRRVEFYMLETNRELISTFTNIEMVKHDLLRPLQMANSLEEYTGRYTESMVCLFRRILEQAGGSQSRHIHLAKQYIDGHLSGPIRLSDAAAYVGLSPVYLSALFKKKVGCNFSNYVNQRRVEAAKSVLAEDGVKIQAVAEALGFYDSHYFSRVFRAVTGMNPTGYRASVRKKDGNKL